jgi:acetyl-CoA carboxylase carboxyltransferase component
LKSIGGTVTALGAGESSPRKNAQQKIAKIAITTTAGLTKVRYRSELLEARERNERDISDCRFQISDLQKAARTRTNPIENRQSKFDNEGVAAETGL